MRTGELEGELGYINALLAADSGCFPGGGLYFLRFLEPVGQRGIGEQACGEGAGIHDADGFLPEAREKVVHQGCVLKGVLIVGKDAVDLIFGVIENLVEGLHGVAGESYCPDKALFLEGEGGRDGLFPDLWEIDELDIMEQEDVEIVRAEAVEGNVDAFINASGSKVEVGE